MEYRNKALWIILTTMALIFIFACGQQSTENKSTVQTPTLKHPERKMEIDTFSAFPPEIDGCYCNYAKDSIEFRRGEYIFMSDFAQIYFLTINGELTKFTQTNSIAIGEGEIFVEAKSDIYEMTIEEKEISQNGDESWLRTGTITLTDLNGKTISTSFYGECGC
jgi:hypothetical protein